MKRNDAIKREKKRQEELRKRVIPPWIALDASKSIIECKLKEKIIGISKNERNFMVGPPEEIFEFDLLAALPYIQGALKEDPQLEKMRYTLVPKKLKEIDFFRNYFYRVSLAREQMGFEALPVGDVELMPEEASCPPTSIAMGKISTKTKAEEQEQRTEVKEAVVSAQSTGSTEEEKSENGTDPVASKVTLSEEETSSTQKEEPDKSGALPLADAEDDMDLGLESEFITDDFVNIGMRDAMGDHSKENTGLDGDADNLDLQALESMVEEIENSSELP